MRREIVLLSSLVIMGLSGCAQPQGDDRLREKAAIESKTQQDTIDSRAREMEGRLLRQQRFFQAISGRFTGSTMIDSSPFDFVINITSTIPVFDESRVRSVDEITYDLTNLALNIDESASARHKDGTTIQVGGCIYTGLKPRVDSGFVFASAPLCPRNFTLKLDGAKLGPGSIRQSSEAIAKKVLDGEIDRIDELNVEMRSTLKSTALSFKMHRED